MYKIPDTFTLSLSADFLNFPSPVNNLPAVSFSHYPTHLEKAIPGANISVPRSSPPMICVFPTLP